MNGEGRVSQLTEQSYKQQRDGSWSCMFTTIYVSATQQCGMSLNSSTAPPNSHKVTFSPDWMVQLMFLSTSSRPGR